MKNGSQKVSEYDQEIPQLHTAFKYFFTDVQYSYLSFDSQKKTLGHFETSYTICITYIEGFYFFNVNTKYVEKIRIFLSVQHKYKF